MTRRIGVDASRSGRLDTGSIPSRGERQVADQGWSVTSVIPRLKQRLNAALLQAFWNWAGVPSGPLGWVSSRTVLWSGSYPAVADALRLRPDDELLELGCGSAGFLAGQAGRVRRVAGIDLSDIQVDLARRRLARLIASGTAEIVAGDAAALPWPEDTFTVVTCMSVFEAFPNPEQVLSEVYRVLRPGGRAVLNIGERVAEGTQTHQAWGGITVWAEADVRRMVEEAGFTDVTIHYVPWAEPGLVSRTFAKVIGPIGGDLRLAGGIKPSESTVDVRPDLPVKGEREVRTVARERRDSHAARPKPGRVPEFTRTITVDAPVEKVFAITRDPELWMGAFPGRIEISDVKVTPEGVGTTFRFTEKTFGITSTGTHEYLEYVPDRRLVTKSSRGPVFTWTFERVDGATTLTLHVVETGLSRAETIIDRVFRTFFEGLLDSWLANLKAVLETGRSPSVRSSRHVSARATLLE